MMKEEGIKLRYALSVVSNSSLVGIGLIRIKGGRKNVLLEIFM